MNDFSEEITKINSSDISEDFFNKSSEFLLDKLEKQIGIKIEILDKNFSLTGDVYLQTSFRGISNLNDFLTFEWQGVLFFQIQDGKNYIYVIFLAFLLGERLACLDEQSKSILTTDYDKHNWSDLKWNFDEYGEWENYKSSPYKQS